MPAGRASARAGTPSCRAPRTANGRHTDEPHTSGEWAANERSTREPHTLHTLGSAAHPLSTQCPPAARPLPTRCPPAAYPQPAHCRSRTWQSVIGWMVKAAGTSASSDCAPHQGWEAPHWVWEVPWEVPYWVGPCVDERIGGEMRRRIGWEVSHWVWAYGRACAAVGVLGLGARRRRMGVRARLGSWAS